MMTIPQEALVVLSQFAFAFTQPTYQRFLVLVIASILTTGRRNIANVVRTLSYLASGDPCSYNRFLSEARWSALHLGCLLARLIVAASSSTAIIRLVGDDTVSEHRGKSVYGKSRHRDAVRSSHSYTAHRYGHKWVVLAVQVSLPFTWRTWTLPIMAVLYRSPKVNAAEKRRHRTPVQLMQWMLRVIMHWFPDRQFSFAGDGGFGTHELAKFVGQRSRRLTLVSRFYADANIYEPPPARKPGQTGRPRVKGQKLPSPKEVVATIGQRQQLTVSWYGGGQRLVEVVSGVGHWYKSGEGLVPVRWVYVHDKTGTHRDDYLFSTNLEWTAKQIIEEYTGRWNIETMFQEMRSYLGLETTCGRKKETVLRAEPCLFGLYSVVVLLYQSMPAEQRGQSHTDWKGKENLTFSDIISSVRRWLWQSGIFASAGYEQTFSKLPEEFQDLLLNALAPAA